MDVACTFSPETATIFWGKAISLLLPINRYLICKVQIYILILKFVEMCISCALLKSDDSKFAGKSSDLGNLNSMLWVLHLVSGYREFNVDQIFIKKNIVVHKPISCFFFYRFYKKLGLWSRMQTVYSITCYSCSWTTVLYSNTQGTQFDIGYS